MIESIVIKFSDVARCPITSLSPTHYFIGEDQQVHCLCEKKERVEGKRMRKHDVRINDDQVIVWTGDAVVTVYLDRKAEHLVVINRDGNVATETVPRSRGRHPMREKERTND